MQVDFLVLAVRLFGLCGAARHGAVCALFVVLLIMLIKK